VVIDYTTPLLFKAEGTAEAVRKGLKDVTRRLSPDNGRMPWRVGAWAKCYEKSPRAGGEPFGRVLIIAATEEPLSWISRWRGDVKRERTVARTAEQYIGLFRQMHGLPADENPMVWRIVFSRFTPEVA
jgi:hypothetical protein